MEKLLFAALLLVTLLAVYLLWIRPALKTRPSFAYFREQEDTLWKALNAKFGGLKQKLATAFVTIATVVVTMYDQLAPLVSTVDISPITAKVPSWAWPLIVLSSMWLVQYFRNLSDKRVAGVLQDKGIDPAPIVGVPAAISAAESK